MAEDRFSIISWATYLSPRIEPFTSVCAVIMSSQNKTQRPQTYQTSKGSSPFLSGLYIDQFSPYKYVKHQRLADAGL